MLEVPPGGAITGTIEAEDDELSATAGGVRISSGAFVFHFGLKQGRHVIMTNVLSKNTALSMPA